MKVSLEAPSGSDRATRGVMLRMLPGSATTLPAPTDAVRKPRRIDWADVEAMAGQFGVSMARGDGWLALGLPKPG